MDDFTGKLTLVTGGAQGIGFAISQEFARAGATVVVLDTDEQAGREAESTLSRSGYNVHYLQANVAEEDDVNRAIDTIQTTYGRLDVLVNNAGVGSAGTLRSRSLDEWDRVIHTNLRAPYMMAKAAIDLLERANPGVIINIASTRALMSEADTEPYSASKGGLLALTHSLAVSLGPKIRVNAISPGWIEVSDWQKQSAASTPTHTPQDESQHPAGRVGHPRDIAAAALFLASPQAGFITGQNFVIDGGMTIKMIYV